MRVCRHWSTISWSRHLLRRVAAEQWAGLQPCSEMQAASYGMYTFCRVWGGLRICRCSMFILIAIQAIFELPPENWRRPPGRPCTTWMKNIHYDLSSLDLWTHEARGLVQNRPLWRLMSLHSTMHCSGACYHWIGLFFCLSNRWDRRDRVFRLSVHLCMLMYRIAWASDWLAIDF